MSTLKLTPTVLSTKWLVSMVTAIALATASNLQAKDITEVKRLYPQTDIIAGGKAQAFIAYGDDPQLEALATELSLSLAGTKKSMLPSVSSDSFVSRWWDIDFELIAGRNIIAIGNINNNRLIATLWGSEYTNSDSIYPGNGGYIIRSVHDPFGKGFNVIVLSGSDIEGIQRSVSAFRAHHLTKLKSALQVSHPIVEVELGIPSSPYVQNSNAPRVALPLFEQASPASHYAGELDKMIAQDRSRSRDPANKNKRTLVNVTASLATLAKAWHNSGDAGLPPLMKRLVDENRDLLQIVPERVEMEGGSASDLIWWDIVEELPIWTDQDRLDITNAFLRDARQGFEPRSAYELVKEGYVQVVGENHDTNSARHLLDAWGYFDKYYGLPETEYWMDIVRATFAGQIASHQILEDSATYAVLAPTHNVEYAFKTRDMRYFQLGIAKTHLDYFLQATQNNAGFATGFGDSTPLQHGQPAVFGRIAWMLRGSEALWWLRDHLPNSCGVYIYDQTIPWDIDIPLLQPRRWTGLNTFPIYKQNLGRHEASKTLVTTPPESVGDQWFNKIVFREGLGTEQQYLLLDGAGIWGKLGEGEFPPGPAGHNHRDMNTIINFTDRGRMWLVDHTYAERTPDDHSGLVITRDGLFDFPIQPAQSLNSSQSDKLAITRTTYENYSDATWERTIFWLRGEHFVIHDRVIAQKEGDFSVRAKFKSLGIHQLDENGLWLEQAGRWCRILSDRQSHNEVNATPFKEIRQWTNYPYAKPIAKNFTQFKSDHLKNGEAMAFSNLIAAADTKSELASLTLEQMEDRSIRIENGDTISSYGLGTPGSFEAAIEAYAFSGDNGLLSKVTSIGSSQSPILTANPAVDISFDADGIQITATSSSLLTLANGKALSLEKGLHETSDSELLATLQSIAKSATQRSSDQHDIAPKTKGNPYPDSPKLATKSSRLTSSAHRLLTYDLDGDSQLEWLVATDQGLTVLRDSGDIKWTFDTSAPCKALDVGDLDGDGVAEIALGSDDEHVYILEASGQERWRFRCKPSERTLPPAVDKVQIIDLDQDNIPEILVSGNWLHCLDTNGKVKWEAYQKFQRNRYSGDVQTFEVGDFDQDARPDIIANFFYNYPVAIGYDGEGNQIFPRNEAIIKHGGLRIPQPRALATLDLFRNGRPQQLVVATKEQLRFIQTAEPKEGRIIHTDYGNFETLATSLPLDQNPFVFTSTDMGAIFAFQAKTGTETVERKWIRSLKSPAKTLYTERPETLWVGTVDGAIVRLNSVTGKIEATTLPSNSPIIQFIAIKNDLLAIHEDGQLESISQD